MKKKVISAVLATAMVTTVLGGCGSSNSDKTTKGGSDAGKSTEKIKMVLNFDTFTNDVPEYEKAVKEVMEMDKYKNVDFEVQSFDADYRTTLPIAISSGEQRDILCVRSADWIKEWANAGIIIPLDDYAKTAGVDYDKTYGVNAVDCKVNDKIYGVPNEVNSWALFYNKAIFDKANVPYPDKKKPMTWSEYNEIAKKLTSGEGEKKVYGALEVDWPQYWYGQAIMSTDGPKGFYTEDGEASNIEDPAFKKALESKMEKMYTDGSIPTYADIKSSKTQVQAFLNGKYGMSYLGAWALDWFSDKTKYPRDWNVGIAPMPVPDGTSDLLTWGSVNYLTVAKTSKNPQLAYEIAKDIEDTACKYATATNANKTLEQPDVFKKSSEVLKDDDITIDDITFLLANPDIKRLPEKVTGKGSTDYLKVLGEETELLFAQEQSVDDTIKNIKKRADEVIASAKN